MNEFELIQVHDDLQKKGIADYDVYKGNDCLWVNYRVGALSINAYYIFRKSRLVDIQYD